MIYVLFLSYSSHALTVEERGEQWNAYFRNSQWLSNDQYDGVEYDRFVTNNVLIPRTKTNRFNTAIYSSYVTEEGQAIQTNIVFGQAINPDIQTNDYMLTTKMMRAEILNFQADINSKNYVIPSLKEWYDFETNIFPVLGEMSEVSSCSNLFYRKPAFVSIANEDTNAPSSLVTNVYTKGYLKLYPIVQNEYTSMILTYLSQGDEVNTNSIYTDGLSHSHFHNFFYGDLFAFYYGDPINDALFVFPQSSNAVEVINLKSNTVDGYLWFDQKETDNRSFGNSRGWFTEYSPTLLTFEPMSTNEYKSSFPSFHSAFLAVTSKPPIWVDRQHGVKHWDWESSSSEENQYSTDVSRPIDDVYIGGTNINGIYSKGTKILEDEELTNPRSWKQGEDVLTVFLNEDDDETEDPTKELTGYIYYEYQEDTTQGDKELLLRYKSLDNSYVCLNPYGKSVSDYYINRLIEQDYPTTNMCVKANEVINKEFTIRSAAIVATLPSSRTFLRSFEYSITEYWRIEMIGRTNIWYDNADDPPRADLITAAYNMARTNIYISKEPMVYFFNNGYSYGDERFSASCGANGKSASVYFSYIVPASLNIYIRNWFNPWSYDMIEGSVFDLSIATIVTPYAEDYDFYTFGKEYPTNVCFEIQEISGFGLGEFTKMSNTGEFAGFSYTNTAEWYQKQYTFNYPAPTMPMPKSYLSLFLNLVNSDSYALYTDQVGFKIEPPRLYITKQVEE